MSTIDAKQVDIDVLTVEVKAIRVGRKQMNQSLFRQLPQENIIDPKTLEIRGTPWCYVNYFWGDCKPDHLHLVWQSGDHIYRDCLYHKDDGRAKAPLNLEMRRIEHTYREIEFIISAIQAVLNEETFLEDGTHMFNLNNGYKNMSCKLHYDHNPYISGSGYRPGRGLHHLRSGVHRDFFMDLNYYLKELGSSINFPSTVIRDYNYGGRHGSYDVYTNLRESRDILSQYFFELHSGYEKLKERSDVFDRGYRDIYEKIIRNIDQFYIAV